MKYKDFEGYMKRIASLMKFEDDISNIFSSNLGECYITNSGVGIAVDLLNEIFHEGEDSVIDFWVYDLECGELWEEGMYTINGNDVKLKTISDLYDLLMKNNAERKGVK